MQPESTAAADFLDDGHTHLAMGEMDEAVACYRQAVGCDGEFFDGWHALAMGLMKLGRYPEAIEAGLKTVDLRPNDQLAWSSLSLMYVRNNQIAEAESAGVKARILGWGGKVAKDAPV